MKKILVTIFLFSIVNLGFCTPNNISTEKLYSSEKIHKVNVDKITFIISEDILKRNTQVQSFGNYTNDIILTVIKNLNQLKSNNSLALDIELTPDNETYNIATKEKVSKSDSETINHMMSELYQISPVFTKETIKFQLFFTVDTKKPMLNIVK